MPRTAIWFNIVDNDDLNIEFVLGTLHVLWHPMHWHYIILAATSTTIPSIEWMKCGEYKYGESRRECTQLHSKSCKCFAELQMPSNKCLAETFVERSRWECTASIRSCFPMADEANAQNLNWTWNLKIFCTLRHFVVWTFSLRVSAILKTNLKTT